MTTAAPHVPHPLHDPARHWPETNCYLDLWIELLAWQGCVPEAVLASAVTQDFEDDQLTFAKVAQEDLRLLYGLVLAELSVYDELEGHLAVQARRGAVTLVEVDAFFLPDTASTTYGRGHSKTTIGVHDLDAGAGTAGYFHNAAHGVLSGRDYAGAFRLLPELRGQPDLLPPYVEFVRRAAPPLDAELLRPASLELLRRHLARRPDASPFTRWRAAFPTQLEALFARPALFDGYAFNFARQGGANFELLGSYARWLAPEALSAVAEACDELARTAKVLQFRLARAVARRRPDPCAECFDALESAYDRALGGLLAFAA